MQLIRHPAIAAGAFTESSTRGGAAAAGRRANARPRPIPFYGELMVDQPGRGTPAVRPEPVALNSNTLGGSIALGCGQFCTNRRA